MNLEEIDEDNESGDNEIDEDTINEIKKMTKDGVFNQK